MISFSRLYLFISFSPSVIPAMKRFGLGFVCLLIYTIFSPYYPDSYYLTDEYEVRMAIWLKSTVYTYIFQYESEFHLFHCLKCIFMSLPQAQPFWYRCVFILLWAKVILYKYVSCWVIAVSGLLMCKYLHETWFTSQLMTCSFSSLNIPCILNCIYSTYTT